MITPRQKAVAEASRRERVLFQSEQIPSSTRFGKKVFNREVMEKLLPEEVYQNLVQTMIGREKLETAYADVIANALKEWAMELGATHYTHWFLPLTGSSAEKHDSFIVWEPPIHSGKVIEHFSGKQLIQGEPDASSFPSGGLRSTYEARGYTGWDPTSPPFVWTAGDGVTLCIPSIFFSWTGEVLDHKLPLLRSDAKINQAVLRLLSLTGIQADVVMSTLGCEQEYFVIDRALRTARPDVLILGKTVCGAPPPKGQELQDHYFGAVKDRVLAFMREFEERALELGIPVKTRHNEVAPAQHEIAPVFEKATLGVDHNILLMELMRQIGTKRNLEVLLHEKPFAELNGSGKHLNWSLSTGEGLNLLDPTDTPQNNLHFLVLLVAILHAIWENSALFRASIGSCSNDDRLGGHEAPPAIISVYLGQELEELLDAIAAGRPFERGQSPDSYQLGLDVVPEFTKDQTDRNRTSPFAFTGNKFEYRAVGSSQNPAIPVTVLNAAVAHSLNTILEEIEAKLPQGEKLLNEVLLETIRPVLQKYITLSKPIRFSGDNYSKEWEKEAASRKLPMLKSCVEAYQAYLDPKTTTLFQGILSEQELKSRYEIYIDIYSSQKEIELKLIQDLFKTQISPAVYKTLQEKLALVQTMKQTLPHLPTKEKEQEIEQLNKLLETALEQAGAIDLFLHTLSSYTNHLRAKTLNTQGQALIETMRTLLDQMEVLVSDQVWPLPKYRELLWLI